MDLALCLCVGTTTQMQMALLKPLIMKKRSQFVSTATQCAARPLFHGRGRLNLNYCAILALRCSAASSSGADDTIILHVGGMMCEGCAANVKRILESRPQVSSATVNLASEIAIVSPVSEQKTAPNWQNQLGEALAQHLTSCGFNSSLPAWWVKLQVSKVATEGVTISPYKCKMDSMTISKQRGRCKIWSIFQPNTSIIVFSKTSKTTSNPYYNKTTNHLDSITVKVYFPASNVLGKKQPITSSQHFSQVRINNATGSLCISSNELSPKEFDDSEQAKSTLSF